MAGWKRKKKNKLMDRPPPRCQSLIAERRWRGKGREVFFELNEIFIWLLSVNVCVNKDRKQTCVCVVCRLVNGPKDVFRFRVGSFFSLSFSICSAASRLKRRGLTCSFPYDYKSWKKTPLTWPSLPHLAVRSLPNAADKSCEENQRFEFIIAGHIGPLRFHRPSSRVRIEETCASTKSQFNLTITIYKVNIGVSYISSRETH